MWKQVVRMVMLWLLFRKSTDSGQGRPRPLRDPEEAEELAFYQTQASIQRSALNRILVMVGLATLLVFLLQYTDNRRAVNAQGIHWQEFHWEAGINAADATVIVLGLLTVAAAISIALVTAVPREEPERLNDSLFVSRLIWSEWTGYALMLSSVIALATALTQFFSVGREIRSIQVTVLIVIGLLSTMLTAGVSGWAAKALSRARNRATLAHLKAILDQPGVVLRADQGWKTQQYICFVLGFALAATALIVLPQYIWHPDGTGQRPIVLGVLTGFASSALISFFTTSLTLYGWRERASGSPADRVVATSYRVGYVMVFVSVPLALGTTRPTPFSLYAACAIIVLLILLPWGFLIEARIRKGRGLAGFAFQRYLLWLDNERARRQRLLEQQRRPIGDRCIRRDGVS